MSNYTELTGMSVRKEAQRKRGFAEWKPQKHTRALLEYVQAVLDEYQEYLPLTLRQIFYRLVGKYDYEKSNLAYDRLSEMVNRARRAHIISMDAIRDDGGASIKPSFWIDTEHFLRTFRLAAGRFKLDRQEGQPQRLALFCEAAGMAPQFQWAADDYGIPVFSSGGFDSTTEKHQWAVKISEAIEPTEVLHIGDHDASGVHAFLCLSEDVTAFAKDLGGEVKFSRLAVTPRQITDLRLPTALPKKTDKRAFRGRTAQAEAIAPDEMARIVRQAITGRFDPEALARVHAAEKAARQGLAERFE